jgi:hypothetical protein
MAAARPASMPTAVSQSDRPAAATAYSPHPDGSARTSVAKAGVTPVLSSPEVRTATASIHPDWLRMSRPATSTPTTAEPILLLATWPNTVTAAAQRGADKNLRHHHRDPPDRVTVNQRVTSPKRV